MKENVLELIKDSANNDNSYEALKTIFTLSEQLQYASNLTQMADDIFLWLQNNFNIDNMVFSIFDIEKNEKEIISQKGEEFFLDDEFSSFFIVNTHTNINAIVSFCANSNVQHQVLQEKSNVIQAAFFLISATIQSGILKKNFIESQSLDSVTNVYNRQYLTTHVKKLLTISKNKNNKIYFLMIGVDHFKAVVDEFNYDIGDKVLIELARVIHSSISEFDMVARLTGDEFLVSLLNHTSEEQVSQTAQKIIENFSKIEVSVNSQHTLQKTVCIGIDEYTSSDSIDDAIKNADVSLYEAKNKGRSVFQHFKDIKEEDTIDFF